jgi:hypothetical protein
MVQFQPFSCAPLTSSCRLLDSPWNRPCKSSFKHEARFKSADQNSRKNYSITTNDRHQVHKDSSLKIDILFSLNIFQLCETLQSNNDSKTLNSVLCNIYFQINFSAQKDIDILANHVSSGVAYWNHQNRTVVVCSYKRNRRT